MLGIPPALPLLLQPSVNIISLRQSPIQEAIMPPHSISRNGFFGKSKPSSRGENKVVILAVLPAKILKGRSSRSCSNRIFSVIF